MRYRLLAAVFAVCLAANGQTMSLEKLVAFLKSSQDFLKDGRMSDRELARFLEKVKLTERLDDREIEELQGTLSLGPKTLEALHALRDHTESMPVAKALPPEAKAVPIPPPSSEEQAAIITEVREKALDYSKELPDFICTQVTRRYAAMPPGTKYGGPVGSSPSWHALDTLTIKLSYFEQKENYKLILVNNTITKQDYGTLGGATSTGDFGSMMKDIFEPGTEARFEWDHWGTLRGRRVMAFEYHVAQSHSQWHITYERSMDIVPAYHGLIYVDAKSHDIMRVTLAAENIPATFPVKLTETVLDYDYQDISNHTFLLPLKATTTMATGDYMTRNDEEFRIYRKYSADSAISFDTADTPPPLPEDKTTETKDPKPAKQNP